MASSGLRKTISDWSNWEDPTKTAGVLVAFNVFSLFIRFSSYSFSSILLTAMTFVFVGRNVYFSFTGSDCCQLSPGLYSTVMKMIYEEVYVFSNTLIGYFRTVCQGPIFFAFAAALGTVTYLNLSIYQCIWLLMNVYFGFRAFEAFAPVELIKDQIKTTKEMVLENIPRGSSVKN